MPVSTFDASTRSMAADPPLARSRPAVPVLVDATADADSELDRLLARRLRQLFVILAAIYALFLVRDAVMRLAGTTEWTWGRTILLLTGGIVQGAVAGAAFRRPDAGRRWYAAAELVTLLTCWLIQG